MASKKELEQKAQDILNCEEDVNSGIPENFYGNSTPINLDGGIVFVET